VADRIPAPEDIGSVDETILPSRACLMSVRDLQCQARRLGLRDAVAAARRSSRRTANKDRQAAAALSCLWEAVCCLELAATVAAPWVDPQLNSSSGAWVEMTRYDPGRANRFYESSHKWTDERFGVISAHYFRHGSEGSMLEIMRKFGVVDKALLGPMEEAQEATARFLRRKFEYLAQRWSEMRGYAAAYEHGLLLVPAEIGEVLDENDAVIPHAILVWETRKEGSRGHMGDSVESAVEAAASAGDLAIDLAHHVADSRLRTIELLEFEDGQVYLTPWQDPFPYWFERSDISPKALERLEREIRLGWIRAEDDRD
jgi:hypothetical protein